MRKKELYCVIGFPTTTAAMACEAAALEAGMPGRLIPLPREIHSGCGLAWRCPVESRDSMLEFLDEREIAYGEWKIIETY